MIILCVISVFCREVDENCVLLGYYAASSGYFLPTFRDHISVLSLWGPIGRRETSARITTTGCVVTQKSAVLKVILSHSISMLCLYSYCHTAVSPLATCVHIRI